MSKVPLSFKPTDEEEEYLEKHGKLDSWTDTVRTWIARDKRLSRKQLMDRMQNSLILIFVGIMAFMLGVMLPSMDFFRFIMVTILFVIAFVSVTYGASSIVWEIYLNVRR
jgi:hypothetical protein